MKADLIIANIGQLVTCASSHRPKRRGEMRDVGLIEDAAVVTAEGKFVAIGRSDQITGEFLAHEVINANGRVVAPGFVDPHTHIVYAGDRLDEFEMKIQGADYLTILENGGGILSTVAATRKASVEELVSLGISRLDKMLESGTTTCEIKSGYGLDTETELKMLMVIEQLDQTHHIDIVPTFLGAHTVPPEFKNDSAGYVDLICDEMLPAVWEWYSQSHFARESRPIFCDVFTERNAFDVAQSTRVLNTAMKLGFAIKSHVDQFTNLGGTRAAIDLNAVSVDHLDSISDEEIAALASSDTVGVVIPTENFNAGKTQYAPIRKMIDSGCAIAMSTDYNPGSAPCPSIPTAIAIACRYQKLLPSEAINASTINAAHAIGLGDRIGSIEVGKNADLVIFDCAEHREIAYEFGHNKVERVLKNGIFAYPK